MLSRETPGGAVRPRGPENAAGGQSKRSYILTAYLFGDLSAAGRREVELELARNAAWRAELEELRRTLALVEDALRGDAPAGAAKEGGAGGGGDLRPYRFDERRMAKVLQAARERPRRRRWLVLGISSAAAIVLAAMGLGLTVFRSRGSAPGWGYLARREAAEHYAKPAASGSGRKYFEQPLTALDESENASVADGVAAANGPPASGDVPMGSSFENLTDVRPSATEDAVRFRFGAVRADTAEPAKQPGVDKKKSEGFVDDLSTELRLSARLAGGKSLSGETAAGSKPGEEAAAEKHLAELYAPGTRRDGRARVWDADRSEMEPSRTAGAGKAPATGSVSLWGDGERAASGETTDASGDNGHVVAQLGKVSARRQPAPAERPAEPEYAAKARGRTSYDLEAKDAEVRDRTLEALLRPEERKMPLQRAPQGGRGGAAALGLGELADAYKLWYAEIPEPKLEQLQTMDTFNDAQQEMDLPPERRAQLEKNLFGFRYYRGLDPRLAIEDYWARPVPVPAPATGDEGLGEEGFRRKWGVHPFVDTRRDALSTFGMDVGTASFQRSRAAIEAGELPPPQAVRVEEFVNSFPEAAPADPESVFTVFSEGGPSPFGQGLELLKVTLKSRELRAEERRGVVLTFAIDASGSMAFGGHLLILREALRSLVESSSLGAADRLAIVAFSSQAYVLLPQTSLAEKDRILAAIEGLEPRGGTNVEAGLDLAYRLADEGLEPRAVNRVVLCSDGLANLGARSPDEVLAKVKGYKERGIYLSVFGLGGLGGSGDKEGEGDRMLLRLANEGNGVYSYLASPAAAASAFGDDLRARLHVLAQDAKVQAHFNPDVVAYYRLLGYEQRDIADADFRNDQRDAGEVGPGATVTVLYEILRRPAAPGSLGRIHLRYRDTWSTKVEEVDWDLPPGVLATRLEATTDRFRFIAAVAELAELLRGSYFARDGSYGAVLALLATLSGESRQLSESVLVETMVGHAQRMSLGSILGEGLTSESTPGDAPQGR